MALINVHTNRVSAALPVAKTYAEQIRGRPSLAGWWRAQPDKIQLTEGLVTRLDPVAPGQHLYPIGSGPAVIDDAFEDRYPGIDFGATAHMLRTTSIPYTKDGKFSWVYLGAIAPKATASNIATIFSAVGASTILRRNEITGNIVFQHGSGTVSATPNTPPDHDDKPLCIIAGSDQTTLGLRVNGASRPRVATNNSQTATTFVIGAANTSGLQPAPLLMAEFLIFQEDITLDAEFSAVVEAYARRCYGAAISALG